MTKKTKIMKKNEDEDEFKESTPSEVFYISIKGTWGFSAFLLRHHMIGYSIETDYAYAPWPSTSIYNSKTSQKVVYTLNTSCISRRSLKSKALKIFF